MRSSLLDEREGNAVNQVAVNAQLLTGAVRTDGADEIQLLAALRPQVRSLPLLLRDGEWFSASLQIQPDDLPEPLVVRVVDGEASRQRFLADGELLLGVGVPIPDGESVYFEVFSLDELNASLQTLRNALVVVGTMATGLGVGFGWWIARRATAPLTVVSSAAEQLSDGDLGIRLDESADQDLRRLTTSFNRMADSLEARIERESRFASDVSHELRSPLTTLLTSVAVLENRRLEMSPDGQEALDLLTADVHRLERMVADLIEIARHDAGIAELSWSYTRIPEFVLSVLRRLRADDLSIEVAAEAEAAVVRVDERRLERSLANLIENAAHYGDGATGISIDADAHTVRVAVEDRGPGIPVDERDKIFDRFARGVHSRRRANLGGSGLGLALAAENVATLGGRIWVEDRDGGGARFVVELPRVEP